MARDIQSSPADEQRLEQYGVWVKVQPRDVTPPVLDESFELSDLDGPKPARPMVAAPGRRSPDEERSQDGSLTAEEEQLLDELETEMEPDNRTSPAAVPDEEPLLEDTELPDIETQPRDESADLTLDASLDEELPELELEPEPRGKTRTPEAGQVEVTLSEAGDEEAHFDDLAALETELASVTTRTRGAAGETGSSEILVRIEEELRSIRADLTQLRSELSGLRRSAAASERAAPSSEAGGKGGFLDEDEDETIALTGDELDNILNTAEVTEEAAGEEAPADFTIEESTAPETDGGILSFETPAPEPVEIAEEALAEGPTPASEEGMADEAMVIGGEDLLPTEEASAEELPSELELEELSGDEMKPDATEDLPEIDLEGIPEIEMDAPATAGAGRAAAPDESETIDLETLDIGEEPTVIEAASEAGEEIPELEPELLEEAAEAGEPRGADESELPDVDLEALAAEAEALEGEGPASPAVEDLQIEELEQLSEEPASSAPQEEIEIKLEGEEELKPIAVDAEPSVVDEEVADAEEVLEAEEVTATGEEAESAASSSEAIPDNLKDEIRTVLKYMDHLLEALPDEKIQEFAGSEYFVMYKKLFEDLGLGE